MKPRYTTNGVGEWEQLADDINAEQAKRRRAHAWGEFRSYVYALAGMTFLAGILLGLICQKLHGETVLDAIAIVESGGRDQAVGAAGERGAWQMTRRTWQAITDRRLELGAAVAPFSAAHQRPWAACYAADHAAYIRAEFARRNGRQPTPDELYCCWNLGVSGFARRGWDTRRVPSTTRQALARLKLNLDRLSR